MNRCMRKNAAGLEFSVSVKPAVISFLSKQTVAHRYRNRLGSVRDIQFLKHIR